MANFDATTQAKQDSVNYASSLLGTIKALYANAKIMQAYLTRYQANTDATFNAAINALFSASERQELAAMLSQVNALVTDWESNHVWIKE